MRPSPRTNTSLRSLPSRQYCISITLAALLSCLALPPSATAQAQTAVTSQAVRYYDIPPGSLIAVLNQFAEAADVDLAGDASLAGSEHSPGLRGQYSIDSGFAALLADVPLRAVRQENGRYILRSRPQENGRQSVTSLEAVTVTAAPEDPRDIAYRTPGSVSIITRDDIERFRGTSVGDIFQGVPGVMVGENRNSGGLDVNIRGMQGQGRVPVLIDGSRQETTVYRGYLGVSSRTYVDPDLIGGVRIDKGPTMDAAGTGAVGGLVSMRTLEVDDIIKPGESTGVRLRGTAIGNNSGSPAAPGTPSGYHFGDHEVRTDCISAAMCSGRYDVNSLEPSRDTMDRPGTFKPKSWAGSLAVAKRLERVDLVAAYAQRSQGNYYTGKHGPSPWINLSNVQDRGFYKSIIPVREGVSRFRAEERIVNTNYDSQTALLKSKFYIADDQNLELGWMRYHSKYGQLMPSQLFAFDFARQTEDSVVTANTWTSRYNWNPGNSDWLDLKANLWLTRTRSLGNYYYGTIEGIGDMYGNGETEHYRRWGADVSNTMKFSMLGGGQLRYGFAVQKEKMYSDVRDPSRLENSRANEEAVGRDGNRNENSAFVALQYTPLPSVTLDAGWRYSRYSSHDNKTGIATTDGNRSSGSAPMVGLAWEPLDGLQLYARYAEAIRMPSLFETTSGVSVAGGVDLKPEHVTSREVGLNYLHDGLLTDNDQFRLKFSYFRNHTRDYLTRTLEDAGETGLFRMRNIDSLTLHGMELSLSYDIGMVFAQVGGTRYNHIETCYVGSFRRQACTDFGIASSYVNNMIPPNWHGSVTLGTRLLDRRLTLGMRGTFVGSRNPVPQYDTEGVDSSFAWPVEWQPYRIFDLFASYKLNDSVSFDFNIDNITDRYYLDALSLGLVPAPGRTARASVTLQF